MFAHEVEGRLEIVDALRFIEALVKLERARPFGLGLVGDVVCRAPGARRGGAVRDVALLREPSASLAHHLFDPGNLWISTTPAPLPLGRAR